MRTYAYFRVDGLTTNEIDFLQLLSNFGYEVQENRLVFEQVNIDVSLIYRSNFINLINYTLESKDVLIINGIDSLGSNFKEIYSSVNYIFKKDINLICLEFSKKKITGDLKKFFFHFLKICADFEGRVSSGCAKERKKVNKIGRPEVLNKTQQEEILKKFKNGQSIYSLAKQYSVARTVIQRLLRKSENTTIRDNF